ncbi:MAG TPA: hypothetical protein VI386_24860 [Candidatus Sulfotelmatobacter sp.]
MGNTALAGIPDKGRSSFVTGLGEGARAEQADQANQQAIKFKDFDSQVRAAQLHNDDLRLQNQTEAQQNANNKEWEDRHDWLSDHGYDDNTIPNHADAATNHLTSATAINGAASVPAGSGINPSGDTIHIPADTQATRDAQKQQYDNFASVYGLPGRDQKQDFVPGKQVDFLNHAMRGLNPNGSPIEHDKLPGAIAALQTQRDAVASGKNVNPAQLNQLDNTIGIMKANLKALDDHAISVKQQTKQAELDAENSPQSVAGAANKASAVEAAKQPLELQKIKAQQAIKDGDPNAAGQMLANGDIAPSQIISTRNPAFAQQAFAAAKSADPTYNPQRAEGEFKAANSPTNIGFFGSAKSLTDPGGTLEQLEAAYRKLPNGQIPKLNTIADWKATASGSGATAGFAQTALGVADDYAKVMGGGQGSDSAREEMLKSFAMASSPKQMEASIDAARGAVGSQMQSRIGSNKAMARMYGDHMPQPTQYATAPGKPRMMSRDGGKTWQTAIAQ